MEELYAKASTLAGRDVEVEKTRDGKFIVLYMEFEASPPEKGKTESEALENFIKLMIFQTPITHIG